MQTPPVTQNDLLVILFFRTNKKRNTYGKNWKKLHHELRNYYCAVVAEVVFFITIPPNSASIHKCVYSGTGVAFVNRRQLESTKTESSSLKYNHFISAFDMYLADVYCRSIACLTGGDAVKKNLLLG